VVTSENVFVMEAALRVTETGGIEATRVDSSG
jgi:hypothetical protein